MKYIILHWNNVVDIAIVPDEDSDDCSGPLFFETYSEAEDYAEKELPLNWKVVCIE
jgi:hypothetical protein